MNRRSISTLGCTYAKLNRQGTFSGVHRNGCMKYFCVMRQWFYYKYLVVAGETTILLIYVLKFIYSLDYGDFNLSVMLRKCWGIRCKQHFEGIWSREWMVGEQKLDGPHYMAKMTLHTSGIGCKQERKQVCYNCGQFSFNNVHGEAQNLLVDTNIHLKNIYHNPSTHCPTCGELHHVADKRRLSQEIW